MVIKVTTTSVQRDPPYDESFLNENDPHGTSKRN